MSETAETKPAVGFDPRAFAEEHNFRSASLSWHGHFYSATAWLSGGGCETENGKTASEAIETLLRVVRRNRARPLIDRKQELIDRRNEIEKALTELEAPALAEAQS